MRPSSRRRATSAPPARRRVTDAKLVLFRHSLVRGSESATESSNYRHFPNISSASSVIETRVIHFCDMDQRSEQADTKEQGFVTNLEDPFTRRRPDQTRPRDVKISPRTSLHPSPSNLSLKTDSMRPASIRSSGSKNGSSRHALLKPEASRQHAAEKDLPVPPILTQSDAILLEGPLAMPEAKLHTLTKEEAVGNPPTKVEVDPIAADIKDSKPPGVAKVHHTGLVSGADSCDKGTEVDHESPILTP
ncbi:uncharacterized protein PG998_001334 [Apiospora kogelbergensis]|uniref:uncharacterized protein n=1 Tax=Apiospora kogelbergensis TaxID=1337665 RepID=UPI003131708B